MNKHILEGKWKQVRGEAKAWWGKLTDNDIEYIAGKREKFAGKLQERYGMSKQEAEKKADEWITALRATDVGREQHTGARS